MSHRDLIYKTALFLFVMAYYLGGYFIINEYTAGLSRHYNLSFPYEATIPFIPGFIFAYMMIFFLLGFTYAVITDLEYFKKTVQAFLLCITIHFACFLLLPVEYQLRPDLDPTSSWVMRVVHYYYWLDLPYNCFPSMHISNCFLVVFILHRYNARLTWLVLPVTLMVAIACVVVKQHYVADVLAGLVVAWFCYYWVWLRKPAGDLTYEAGPDEVVT